MNVYTHMNMYTQYINTSYSLVDKVFALQQLGADFNPQNSQKCHEGLMKFQDWGGRDRWVLRLNDQSA